MQRQAKSGGQVFERNSDVARKRHFHGGTGVIFDFGGLGAGVGEAGFGFLGFPLAFLRFEPILSVGLVFADVGELASGPVVGPFVGGLVADLRWQGQGVGKGLLRDAMQRTL